MDLAVNFIKLIKVSKLQLSCGSDGQVFGEPGTLIECRRQQAGRSVGVVVCAGVFCPEPPAIGGKRGVSAIPKSK